MLDHGIENPVFVIDCGENLIALGTELPGSSGCLIISAYMVDPAVTGIRKHGAGIVAVAWTHVPGDFIGLPIQGETPPFTLLLCYYYTIDEC